MKKSILALVVCLTILACSKKEETTSSTEVNYSNTEQRYPLPEGAIIKEVLSNARVGCDATTGPCPSNVGLLARLVKAESGRYQIGLCTATLVDDDILLTNAHCIDQISCSEGAVVNFYGDSFVYECKEVLFHSGDYTKHGTDYAFFRLKTAVRKWGTERSPQKLSRAGLIPNEEYSAFMVNPSSSVSVGPYEVWGTLKKKTCTMRGRTHLIAPKFTSEDSTFVSFEGAQCDLIPGNSGSALIAKDGTIRGVVQAIVTLEKLYQAIEQSSTEDSTAKDIDTLIKNSELPGKVYVGTNLRCMSFPQFKNSVNASLSGNSPFSRCNQVGNYLSADEIVFQNFERSVLEEFTFNMNKDPSMSSVKGMIELGVETEANSIADHQNLNLKVIPKCVKPWASGEENRSRQPITVSLNQYQTAYSLTGITQMKIQKMKRLKNLTWQIQPEGDLSFTVSPVNHAGDKTTIGICENN